MASDYSIPPTALEGHPGKFVRVLSYDEMTRVMALDDNAQLSAIVDLAIVDASGKRLFADGAAGKLPWPVVVDMARKANAANSVDFSDAAIADAEKN